VSDVAPRVALGDLDFATIGPRVGERFPDVRLPDQSGAIVDLHARRAGRLALFVFYRSAKW
jgi:peroxiredoxin